MALRQKLSLTLYTTEEDEKESSKEDPYSSDDFRMYEFKVSRCGRGRSHDWPECPFAHPGEKAYRRDPRRFHYSGNVCTEFRKRSCTRGDACEFSHGVFECWLHPARYRTQPGKDGKDCKRKVCFFAHTPRQLRVLPLVAHSSVSTATRSHRLPISSNAKPCGVKNSSPTSILNGLSYLSPPFSPPLTPPLFPRNNITSGFRVYSPLSEYQPTTGMVIRSPRNETLLREIVDSMGTMDIRASSSSSGSLMKSNLSQIASANDIGCHWSFLTSFSRDFNGQGSDLQGEEEEVNGE